MRFSRSSGTLVHPTSFPSAYGIGDLGSGARKFINFMNQSNQRIWQVLPLGPTGYGYSPYASYSAFAGNQYLISPDILVDKGLVSKNDADKIKVTESLSVNYDEAYKKKREILRIASRNFYNHLTSDLENDLLDFKKRNQNWLDDYCLFIVCSKLYGRKPWNTWDPGIAQRKQKKLKEIRNEHKDEIKHEEWMQFEFFNQWFDLKKYTNDKNIRIVGDIPIFVDHNSADVWSNTRYFAVDKQGNRQLVAGVPPDYFSETGQLWGNPLYKWDELEKDGFSWWIERFDQMFNLFDAIRVDHFRGFEAYWEVPAEEKTAVRGNWVKGPGSKLFKTIHKELGELPIIAEDLGFVTPEVRELRDYFQFPGMKILQFAFESDSSNEFLPHNYDQNCVVYTGTHDNDTTIGWFNSAPEVEKHRAREYTRSDGSQMNWEFIRLGMLSVADQAIFPLQDYMNLGSEYRMNTPGTVGNNWQWRFTQQMLDEVDTARIRNLIELSNRKLSE